MVCSKCGKELENGTSVCPNCGEKLITEKTIVIKDDPDLADKFQVKENNGYSLVGVMFSFIFGPIGLIFSILGLIKAKSVHNDGKILAKIGIIISILNIITILLMVIFINHYNSNEEARINYCNKFENHKNICVIREDKQYDCILTHCDFDNVTKESN